MSIGINYDDENDPYFDQPIGYHFDDIEWEYFILNEESQHRDNSIHKNKKYNPYKDFKLREAIEKYDEKIKEFMANYTRQGMKNVK